MSKFYTGREMYFSRFSLAIVFFGLWVLAQLIIPVKLIPITLLEEVEILKLTIPAVGITFCGILFYDKLRFMRIVRPFILFVAFCLFKSLFIFAYFGHVLDLLANSIMYTLWVGIIFVIAPSVFDSLTRVRIFLQYMIATMCLFLITSVWLSSFLISDYSFFYTEGRLTLIYQNPLYLGGIAYSIICCCMLLRQLSESRSKRVLLSLIFLLGCWVIIEAWARTFIVGILVLLYLNFYLQSKLQPLVFLSTATFFCVVMLLYFFQVTGGEDFSYSSINSLSSGRIGNWSSAILSLSSYWRILWGEDGNSNYIKTLVTASDESVEATFQRYSIDNSYIELIVNTGIIGAFLFVWGLANIFKFIDLSKLSAKSEGVDLAGAVRVSYAIFISVVVSAFSYGHYPSLGNTINAVVLPSTMSIIFLAIRNHKKFRKTP